MAYKINEYSIPILLKRDFKGFYFLNNTMAQTTSNEKKFGFTKKYTQLLLSIQHEPEQNRIFIYNRYDRYQDLNREDYFAGK